MTKADTSVGYDVLIKAEKDYSNTTKNDRGYVGVIAHDDYFGAPHLIELTVAEELDTVQPRNAQLAATVLSPARARELAKHLTAAADVAEAAEN